MSETLALQTDSLTEDGQSSSARYEHQIVPKNQYELTAIRDISDEAAGIEAGHHVEVLDQEDIEALAREARTRLKPPKGLEIQIEKDHVALETARQVDAFRRVISGSAKPVDVQLHEGQQTKGPLEVIDQLSDLATLYVEDSDFENLYGTLVDSGVSEVEAQSKLDELMQAHKIKVAKILKHSIRADDILLHSGRMLEIALDGRVKTRGKLMKEGKYFAGSGAFTSSNRQTPRAIIDQMTEQNSRGGFGDATHSLLFHARQRTEVESLYPSLFLSINSVIERTPILISGQDQRQEKGVRIKGNDEAHGKDKTRHEFGGVIIHASEEYLASLPEVEDRVMINDLTFMSPEPSAETAYDYSYEVADGIIIMNEGNEVLLERLIEMIPPNSYIRQVESMNGVFEKHSLFNISNRLLKLRQQLEAGNPPTFKSPDSERAWANLLQEFDKVKEVFDEQFTGSELWELNEIEHSLAETAVIRFLMREAPDISERTIDALFIVPPLSIGGQVHDKLCKSLTEHIKRKSGAVADMRYIGYKQVQLGFGQEDMSRSVVEEYTKHHS